MSYFGNYDKDILLSDMIDFLENHTVSDLLDIVQAAVYSEEQRRERE